MYKNIKEMKKMDRKALFGVLLGQAINDLPRLPKYSDKTPLSYSSLKEKKNKYDLTKFMGKVIILSGKDYYHFPLYMPIYPYDKAYVGINVDDKHNVIPYTYNISSYKLNSNKPKITILKEALKKAKPVFKQIKITIKDKNWSKLRHKYFNSSLSNHVSYSYIYEYDKTLIDVLYKLPNENYVVRIQKEGEKHNPKLKVLSGVFLKGNYREIEVVKKIDKNSVTPSDVYKNLTNINSKKEDLENPENICKLLKQFIDKIPDDESDPDWKHRDTLNDALKFYEKKLEQTDNKNSESAQLEM